MLFTADLGGFRSLLRRIASLDCCIKGSPAVTLSATPLLFVSGNPVKPL